MSCDVEVSLQIYVQANLCRMCLKKDQASSPLPDPAQVSLHNRISTLLHGSHHELVPQADPDRLVSESRSVKPTSRPWAAPHGGESPDPRPTFIPAKTQDPPAFLPRPKTHTLHPRHSCQDPRPSPRTASKTQDPKTRGWTRLLANRLCRRDS